MSDHYQTVCNAFEDPEERRLAADMYRHEFWNRVESGEIDTAYAVEMLREKIDRITAIEELKTTKQGVYGKIPQFKMEQLKRGGCNHLSYEQRMELESRRGY